MSTGPAAEIKSRLNVVEVVGETVALKRAGTAYKGLCPFHVEKTPSFVVSPDRDTWHCFGCGEGGDIFTFLMRRDGLDFREALGRLAERAGVELSERTAREDRLRRRLREALEAANAWYREVLLQWPGAEPARGYLAERGLSEATLERFGIGYAPATWDALTKRLRARGFSEDELVSAGLASRTRHGGVVDRFRGRVMIPIRDPSGRAVGLGGRILPGREGPKYLNSPATPLFDKSRTLFAIDLAKGAIRREKLAVIVEGYTDVMSAHQGGFENVVASLGTALTRGQIELATRYADGVALAYDVDLAGEAATQRGLLEELGPDQNVGKVRVVRIPAGKDPDELIRSDPESWRRAVDDARPVLEYFIDRVAAEVDPRTPGGRSELSDRILEQLVRVASPIQRDSYIPILASRTGIDERALRESLQRRLTLGVPRRRGRVGPSEQRVEPELSPLEEQLVELLLRHPRLAGAPEMAHPLPLSDSAASGVIEAVRGWTVAGERPTAEELGTLVEALDPLSRRLAKAAIERSASEPKLTAEQAATTLRVCILRLKVRRIEEQIADAGLVLQEANRTGERSEIEAITAHITRLGRERAEVTRAIHEPAELAGARR